MHISAYQNARRKPTTGRSHQNGLLAVLGQKDGAKMHNPLTPAEWFKSRGINRPPEYTEEAGNMSAIPPNGNVGFTGAFPNAKGGKGYKRKTNRKRLRKLKKRSTRRR